jgi:hypothetical protein
MEVSWIPYGVTHGIDALREPIHSVESLADRVFLVGVILRPHQSLRGKVFRLAQSWKLTLYRTLERGFVQIKEKEVFHPSTPLVIVKNAQMPQTLPRQRPKSLRYCVVERPESLEFDS